MNKQASDENEVVTLPEWAVELGLNEEVFSLLVRQAFERGVPPVVVVREWITEMAAKMVAA